MLCFGFLQQRLSLGVSVSELLETGMARCTNLKASSIVFCGFMDCLVHCAVSLVSRSNWTGWFESLKVGLKVGLKV